MIRNGNICFVPTRLAAPEICDREFISGLSVSPVALTPGTYQTDCGSVWPHLFRCVKSNVKSRAGGFSFFCFFFWHPQIATVQEKRCEREK